MFLEVCKYWKRGPLAAPEHSVSDACLTLSGVSLGVKYKERGVARKDLEQTLDGLLRDGKINLLYKQAILSGYDRNSPAK